MIMKNSICVTTPITHKEAVIMLNMIADYIDDVVDTSNELDGVIDLVELMQAIVSDNSMFIRN